ncbi:DNA replication and repair protein RecF [Candidatus Thioglobus sp.]|nr:DNA replication and repair protein RecF [Candidatus Thioglobus sp.]MDC1289845.1 DNA replication and repair protein RecF [Candidatus Thioglobus sp.]
MAIIEKLHVARFRNLNDQYLEPNKNINLILGSNGQGKTNFIESIYYLGHSRSFKTKNIKDVIPFEKDRIQINAIIDGEKVTLSKSKSKSTIVISTEKITSNSLLSQHLPTQIISPDRGFIVGGPPKLKRSYLDWGVFHDNKDVLKTYKSYNKTLKNINAILTGNNQDQLEEWFSKFAFLSVEITQARINYIQKLTQILEESPLLSLKSFVDSTKSLEFKLQTGWVKDVDSLNQNEIKKYLQNNKSSIIKTKHLGYGPHRASIDFYLSKKNEGFLSRGEQKKLSIVFWMLQVLVLAKDNSDPVVLIDDISSELDQEKINSILDFLTNLNIQIFITDIGNKDLPLDPKKTNIYLIKNGVITSV